MIVRDEVLIIFSVCVRAARGSRGAITSQPGSGYRALTWEICVTRQKAVDWQRDYRESFR